VIEVLVKREAKAKGLSLHKAFITLMEKSVVVKTKGKKKKALYHDLDDLFGVWSKNDAVIFNNTLQLLRKEGIPTDSHYLKVPQIITEHYQVDE